jgi:hypothetical protein
MKKWSVFIGMAAVITVAGTAFAVRLSSVYDVSSGISAERAAAVETEKTPVAQAALSSGCGSSECGAAAAGSGCCKSGAAPAQAQIERIRAYIHDYYAAELDDPSIKVDVQDLGCHQEATVTRAGKVIKRLSINGGRITDIT